MCMDGLMLFFAQFHQKIQLQHVQLRELRYKACCMMEEKKGISICFLSQNGVKILLVYMHSIYIRTVSYNHLLSTLQNWYRLVYGPFRQRNMHHTLKFCPDQ